MATQNMTVVFPGPRQVVLENMPVPELQPGEFLVRTRRTLISTGTELMALTGEGRPDSVWGSLRRYPAKAGYSNVGEVIKLGPGVAAEWLGRKVATYRAGYHAQYVVGSTERSYVIPDGVPDDQATFFILAMTAMNAVRQGRVTWGEATVVYGLGIVGQLVARFCQCAGASLVAGIDLAPTRIGCLPPTGHIVGFNPASQDVLEELKARNHGRLADVVFEATGNPDIIPGEFGLLKRQGRFVVISSPRGKTPFDFHDLCNWPSYQIIGAHVSSHPPAETPENPWTHRRHAEQFFDLVAGGDVDLQPLISHRQPFEKAPEMYAMLLEDRTGAMGVVLEW